MFAHFPSLHISSCATFYTCALYFVSPTKRLFTCCTCCNALVVGWRFFSPKGPTLPLVLTCLSQRWYSVQYGNKTPNENTKTNCWARGCGSNEHLVKATSALCRQALGATLMTSKGPSETALWANWIPNSNEHILWPFAFSTTTISVCFVKVLGMHLPCSEIALTTQLCEPGNRFLHYGRVCAAQWSRIFLIIQAIL